MFGVWIEGEPINVGVMSLIRELKLVSHDPKDLESFISRSNEWQHRYISDKKKEDPNWQPKEDSPLYKDFYIFKF